MPVSVVDFYKLDRKLFEESGAFDALLDWDTLLFIDPFLLQKANTPEFLTAHESLLDYFRKVLKLITHSKSENDKAWTEAVKRLTFGEIGTFGLGYAQGSSAGSGIGPESAEDLARSIKEISNLGIKDEELFELVGLFENGFGADRISDMTCNILLDRFASFTQRVFKDANANVELSKFKVRSAVYEVPSHPYKKQQPVLLCPKELLRDLPTAEDNLDIAGVCEQNEEVRNSLNAMLGADWRQQLKEVKKSDLRKIFINEPKLLKDLLAAYKKCPVDRYNFEADRSGEVVWREIAESITAKHPLDLKKQSPRDLDFYISSVRTICETFKTHIEQNGLWEALFSENGRQKKERISQRLFFSVADIYCKVNDLDISPESNAGRGPVDFKFSYGSKNKILVEIKLSSSSKLIDGYTLQTETYKQAESAAKAFYLVIQVGEHDDKIKKLFDVKNELAKQGDTLPEIITVDALKKISASKLKKNINK